MAAPSRSIRGPGTRSGSTSGVEVLGLSAFRKELRQLEDPKPWTRELGQINRSIAKQAAGWAQSEARAMGGPQRHFAAAIRGYGSAASARVAIKDEDAYAAFWGAKQRTGWNAGNKTPNQPEWVGNTWQAAVSGQGPYAVNDAIAEHLPQIEALYIEGVEDLARRAFPD